MVRFTSTAQRPAWLRLLFGFGPILVFGGALFLMDGTWQVGRDYVQRTKWPAVRARVEGCSIYDTWDYAGTPSTKTALSKRSYVRCRLRYQVGDSEQDGIAQAGDAITTYGMHRLFFAKLTTAKMHQWIAGHHPGSLLLVHYDPSDPNNLSLAGQDTDLKGATPSQRLWFGGFACAGGLLIIAIAKQQRE